MSAHVLLISLNELGKRDKKISFLLKKVIILSLCTQHCIMDVITFPENLLTTCGLSILMHGVISLSEATSYHK